MVRRTKTSRAAGFGGFFNGREVEKEGTSVSTGIPLEFSTLRSVNSGNDVE
ncbi:hypothetical protein C7460_11720 [Marinoscillum furvescens DSM 4134]|uniref:Uncharacterized protein n=1 Tax=Marinoscillum furvescens DSM 4134 TaxID=1122208 RepID=A0A3D9L086_MARFU|nr:hypothetical protein C7460_11720 [Marinoscillum furvescens DSM 4134]